MRYKADQKAATRKKMLDAIGRGFRHRGYAGIGVDGLAKAADVTSGAFYTHFGSKRAAFDAALEAGLDEVIDTIPKLQQEHGDKWVGYFAEYYLGEAHRKDTECGCAMTSLTPEVIRSDNEVHQRYEDKMAVIIELVAAGLLSVPEGDRCNKAWALLSVLIGGLNVARAVNSEAIAEEISRAVVSAAIEVAGKSCDRPK